MEISGVRLERKHDSLFNLEELRHDLLWHWAPAEVDFAGVGRWTIESCRRKAVGGKKQSQQKITGSIINLNHPRQMPNKHTLTPA
jgi:hypothetical protein